MTGMLIGFVVIAGLAAFSYIMYLTDKLARESERRKSLEKEKEDANETANNNAKRDASSIDIIDEQLCEFTRDD